MSKSIFEDLYKQDATDQLCDITLEIIKTRKSQNMTQEDLARKAGVETKQVNYLESFIFEKIPYNVFWKVLFALDMKLKVEK